MPCVLALLLFVMGVKICCWSWGEVQAEERGSVKLGASAESGCRVV